MELSGITTWPSSAASLLVRSSSRTMTESSRGSPATKRRSSFQWNDKLRWFMDPRLVRCDWNPNCTFTLTSGAVSGGRFGAIFRSCASATVTRRELNVAGNSPGILIGGSSFEAVPLRRQGAVGRISDEDVGKIEANSAEKILRRGIPDGNLQRGAVCVGLVVTQCKNLVPLGRVGGFVGPVSGGFGSHVVARRFNLHERGFTGRSKTASFHDSDEQILHRLHQIKRMNPLGLITTFLTRDILGRVITVGPLHNLHPLPSVSLHFPHLGLELHFRHRTVTHFRHRRILRDMHHRRRRFLHNHNARRMRRTCRKRHAFLHGSRSLKNPSLLDNHDSRRRLVLLQSLTLLLLLGQRRFVIFKEHIIVVINPEANFAPYPTENAPLLERVVDESFFTSPGKLGSIELDPTKEVVLAAASVAELLVVVELHLQLLKLHVIRVRHDELQRLVPHRVQLLESGRRSLPLPVEVHHHVRARATLSILREQVTRVDYFHHHSSHALGSLLKRRRHHLLIFLCPSIRGMWIDTHAHSAR
ncbi:hypothetical protein CR513_03362, partial [Mucuna pruriens]